MKPFMELSRDIDSFRHIAYRRTAGDLREGPIARQGQLRQRSVREARRRVWGAARFVWGHLIGLDDRLDRFLRAHRRRIADRIALVIGGLGVVAIAVAIFHNGKVGHLGPSDLVSVGGVLVTGAGLIITISPGASPDD